MRRGIALALAIALAFTAAGCGDRAEAPHKTTRTMRISAVLPHDGQGYWSSIAEGITTEAASLSADAKIYVPQINYNVSQMADIIRQSTAASVDALIVQGIDDPDYIDALNAARREGILIGLIDSDLPSLKKHLYVGTDNFEAGALLGGAIARDASGRATVAVLSGGKDYPNLELRLEGLKQAFEGEPGIELRRVEYAQFDALSVMEKYYQILREEPDVDTLILLEGTGGQTLGQLLQPEDTPLERIYAFDLTEDSVKGLQKGLFDGLLAQQPVAMGRRMVQELYYFNEMDKSADGAINTGARFITSADLDAEGGYAQE